VLVYFILLERKALNIMTETIIDYVVDNHPYCYVNLHIVLSETEKNMAIAAAVSFWQPTLATTLLFGDVP
jgi:hypothetical protein